MNYIIRAVIDPDASAEDLLGISDADIAEAEAFFLKSDITQKPSITIDHGYLVYPDGRSIPFKNYKSLVVTQFDQGEDRYWITYDGGGVNVSSLIKMLREAVEDARSGSE